ncbi:MAG: hypothetical protein ACK416_03635 [Zestosphaera sp.]
MMRMVYSNLTQHETLPQVRGVDLVIHLAAYHAFTDSKTIQTNEY